MIQNKKKYCICHAKNTWVAPSATPATSNDAEEPEMPLVRRKVHLPRKMTQKLAESAIPATRNNTEEYHMLHLPHKMNHEPAAHKR